jgi:ATP-dependent Clp protease ATP-binding subunit ClpC
MDMQLDKAGNKALQLAKQEARHLCNKYAGTEHLLLGILKIEEPMITNIFKKIKVHPEDVQQVIYENVYTNEIDVDIKNIQFTPRVAKVIQIAGTCAEKLGRKKIGVEHIFLGLLYEQNGVAVNVLKSFGISFRRVKREFHKQIADVLDIPTEKINDIEDIQHFKNELKKYRTVTQHGVDLTVLAKEGKIDPVIGREREVGRAIQILCRRTKNNPVLVGEAGVGKTAIVELLAQKIADGTAPDQLADKHIIKIDMTSIVAGTKYRGQFEERMKKLLDEIKQCKDIIVFVDEVHTIVNAGAASGSLDASNILKPALSRGQITCIGATTPDEYVKHIESDKALDRRFQMVKIEAPDAEQALLILKGIKREYEKYHGVRYTVGALKAAVELSERYITDRYLPDSAIDILDEVGAKHSLQKNKNMITEEEVEDLVSDTTGVPIVSIDTDTPKFFRRLEKNLKSEIVGQDIALEKVCTALKASHAHLNDPNQPVGTFLFLGSTGVGKTHLCKLLSKYLFGNEQRLVRVDMSEFMEKHSVSKLTGSPPGYLGYDDSNQFVEQVRKYPYSLILFDEIEKAHPQVLDILLQILDEGHMTDGRGRRINFKNTVIVMTSNLGTEVYDAKSIGFKDVTETDQAADLKAAAIDTLKPEFVNRIDDIIIFNQLTDDVLKQIIEIQFIIFADRVKSNYKIKLSHDSNLVDFFLNDGEDQIKKYGARQIKRIFRKHVENKLAELLVSNKYGKHNIHIYYADGAVKFKELKH